MDADFDPLRRELAETQARLGALRAAVDAYFAGRPLRFDGEVNGKQVLLRSFIETPPEQTWATEVPEIALAARSVLDLLVEQLVVANGQDPEGTGVEFPIATDAAAYAKGNRPERDRLLRGVASRHRAIIDSYQPFQAGATAMWSTPLARLEQFGDEAALGPITLGGATPFELTLARPPLSDISVSFDRGLPLVDGAQVIGFDNQPTIGDGSVKADWRFDGFTADIGIRDGNAFVPLADLETAVTQVAEIVDRCVAKA